MLSAKQIADRFRSIHNPSIRADFAVKDRCGNALLVVATSSAAPCLAFVLTEGTDTAARRSTSSVAVRSLRMARIAVRDDARESPLGLVECLDVSQLETFCALCEDLVESLAHVASLRWKDVSDAFARWEMLLAPSDRFLSVEEELGLWGELWCISRSTKADAAVAAWVAEDNPHTDFSRAGLTVECKTGRRRLLHEMSRTQAEGPNGEGLAYLLSLWCGIDAEVGVSLPELLRQVEAQVTTRAGLEQRLLRRGYRRTHEPAYTTRFRILDRPWLFDVRDLPGIRQVDDGVLKIRYMIQLREEKCVTEDLEQHVLKGVFGGLVNHGGGGLRPMSVRLTELLASAPEALLASLAREKS